MNDDTYTRKNSLRLQGFDYAATRAYFVTIVVSERKSVFLNRAFAKATVNCLKALRNQLKFNLYVYCLMPDHFHAIIGIGKSGRTLGEICGAFKSISNRIYWQYGKGRLWQRQFYDHIIRNEEDFFESLEYIRLNPVRKNLVKKAVDWEFTEIVDTLNRK